MEVEMVGMLALGWAMAGQEAAPPALEQVLESAGWTMTPELSATYQAGDIYELGTNSKVASRSHCFGAEPEEGIYTSLQVVQAMKMSASLRLGIVKGKASGTKLKRRTFAEPYISELPLLQQKLRPECADQLSSTSVEGMVVLVAVLSAEVKEETCSELEGGAQWMGSGGGADVKQSCIEESAGHVAVAYKMRAISELLPASSEGRRVARKPARDTIGDPLLELSVRAATITRLPTGEDMRVNTENLRAQAHSLKNFQDDVSSFVHRHPNVRVRSSARYLSAMSALDVVDFAGRVRCPFVWHARDSPSCLAYFNTIYDNFQPRMLATEREAVGQLASLVQEAREEGWWAPHLDEALSELSIRRPTLHIAAR